MSATAGIALAVSLLGKNPTLLKLREEIGLSQKKLSNDLLADRLILTYERINKNQHDAFLENYIKDKSPYQVLALTGILFKKKDPIVSGPLASSLALKAAERYKYDGLRLLVALEYIKGISLEKNFTEARNILESPDLKADAHASYYRGIWWSDSTNPSFDLSKAKIELQFAARHGIKAAEKILIKLETTTQDK